MQTRTPLRPWLAAALLAAGLMGATSAVAQDRAGDFDFYLLSLSWSPSYCASENARPNSRQCAGYRPYAFVVHGLWPQYERGYPENCTTNKPVPTLRDVDGMLDLMPDAGLILHEWSRHGTCSGLDGTSYLDTVRTARAKVAVPAAFDAPSTYLTIAPDDLERAFLKANPGLKPEGIAVTCDGRRLSEVRICMTRDLAFRSCPDVDRRGCRSDKVVMPPVR
ncbi:ribonuclease T2 [Oryzibacter oryziterrae]|uniref:ribonuclease T2 n=1 Tax=Oryzibacter oryziterrae TaxID=2766474 RepID=UPI001F4670F8|nr:ribonuclease T2 [Oryzibacter oryziterrae]